METQTWSFASFAILMWLDLRLIFITGLLWLLSLACYLLITIFRDIHSNLDRLNCPDCGKLFTSKRSLVGHKKEKHSGQLEIFPCSECGKNFSRKSNLKAHMDSIHFGKKFPCSFCERIFTNRSCMNLHVKKTHSDILISMWKEYYSKVASSILPFAMPLNTKVFIVAANHSLKCTCQYFV